MAHLPEDGPAKAHLLDDVLSLVVQAGAKGITQTELMDSLRCNYRAHWRPESGRRWRNLPHPSEMLSWCEQHGFTLTRGQQRGGGYETRVTL